MHAPRLISVIVPCRNEAEHIERFLQCVLAQQIPPGMALEVFIADGNSCDGTREILDSFAASHAMIHVIPNPAGIVSTGLNECIRQARGEIVLRMDVHTIYARDYIAQCVTELEQSQADNVGGPAQTVARTAFQKVAQIVYHSRLGSGGAKFHNVTYEGPVDTVCYGCWHRETLLDLGGFDEQLARNQDDELNLRLIRRGGRIWQSPRIQSWVTPRSSLHRLFRQYLEYGYWKVHVIRKHRLPASWRHLVPAAFVGGLAVLLAGALVSTSALALLAVALLTYILVVLAVSGWLCAAQANWRLFATLPIAFVAVHFAYGIGFWAGICDVVFRHRCWIATPSAGVAGR
ncbi:MAG: glycosyltransferase family 2 protein [Bryobacterales bacterium]|nr:glycosyltransferase family 2 protein [Bryobacterales bacterium]